MKSLYSIAGACVALASATAAAQCSSWNNLLEITAVLGDEQPLIEAELSDQSLFVFWPSYADSCVGFLVNDLGVTVFYTEWVEDENGTFLMDDGYGRYCTVACDGNGVTVLIEETDQDNFIPAVFAISSDGTVTSAAPPVACLCVGSGTRNQVVCTPKACDNQIICKSTGTVASGWCMCNSN